MASGTEQKSDIDAKQNGATVLLVYTLVKWTMVAKEFLSNGVVPGANALSMIYVVPIGIPLWLVGVYSQVVVLYKLSGVGVQATKSQSLAAIAGTIMMLITLVELMYILIVTI